MAFGDPTILINDNLVGGPVIVCGTVVGQTGDTSLAIDLSTYVSGILSAMVIVSGVGTNLDLISYSEYLSTLTLTLPLNSDAITHAGNVNLSGGHDWSAGNQDFSINVNGAGALTVTLDANCINLAAVISEINTKLGVAGVAGVEAYDAGTNFVGIRTTSAIPNQSIILAAGVTDALTTLGWTAGTYENPSTAIKVHFTAIGQ